MVATMIAPCIFIGRDGSMGLRHGEVYVIEIAELTSNIIRARWFDDNPSLWGERSIRECLYYGRERFEQNWKELSC